jgi:murein DD-endopeptidase MepM/ murein hydrolase activator NlpD
MVRTHALSAFAAAVLVPLAPGVAPASAGGAHVPPAGGGAGGALYGSALGGPPRPAVGRFSVTPRTVTSGRALPRLALRIDQPGGRTVRARIVLWPVRGQGAVVRLDLGPVRAGRLLRPRLPAGTVLAPGRYTVRVHATDPAGRTLARRARGSGRSALVVRPARPVLLRPEPAPEPPPTPAPPAAPVPAPPAPGSAGAPRGTFPVAGPFTWGDGVGADRGTHAHQGQDLLAPAGTPVVAPEAGRIRVVDVQASGAGHYLVLTAAGGRRELFFAHCLAGSIVVVPGQAVAARAPLCQVGATGRATTPHLHFEVWPDGWRTSPAAQPADPRPFLEAWLAAP